MTEPAAQKPPKGKPNATQADASPRNSGAVSVRNARDEYGDTGLKRYNGVVTEEFLRDLAGDKGIKLYSEMKDNHPIIGGVMHAVRMLVRGVNWSIEAYDETPEQVKAAAFVSSCLDDMEQSWQDTLSDILSFLEYGFSFHEILYKVRKGPQEEDPKAKSRYSDGKLGWRGFPIRSQDSLYRWDMDETGRVLGYVQHVLFATTTQRSARSNAKNSFERYIPMEKGLLFRTTSHKNNPHGRSILRNAVTSYLRQRRIEDIECIGIERDLAGLPVIYVPGRLMSAGATADEKATFAAMTELVSSVRRDSMEGLVLPSDVYMGPDGTPSSQRLYSFELVSTAGTRQFNTNDIMQRYDTRIAATVLADFILLGHQDVGTYSLGESKTKLFAVALGAFLDIICEIFNRHAIPELLRLNGMNLEQTPELVHADLDEADLGQLGAYVATLAAAGMPLFPDPALEKDLRDRAGLPEPSADASRTVGEGTGDDPTGQDDPNIRPGVEQEAPPPKTATPEEGAP